MFWPLDKCYFNSSLCFGFVASSREIPEPNLEDASIATVKLPLPEKMTPERVYGKNGSMRKMKVPITATPYTVASLQVATNSFYQDSLLGEGSLGRVYKADFPNGKVQYAFCNFVITKIKSMLLGKKIYAGFVVSKYQNPCC
jgi:hypothetical protein